MFKKINFLLVLLLIIVSIGAVSAASDIDDAIGDEAISDIPILDSQNVESDIDAVSEDDISDGNEILSSDASDGEVIASTSHNVSASNYGSYFNSKGELISSSVNDGDTIYLDGEFTNRNFVFKKPVNVVGTSSNVLRGSTVTFYKGASGSTVSNLNIFNNVEYQYGIFLNGATDCVVSGCFVNNTGASAYAICLGNNANYNNITNNNFNAYGITYGHGTRSTSPVLITGSHYNYIASNLISCDDANAIYLSSYAGGPLDGGESTYNTIYNNTIKYNVLPTSWAYGIQVMGKKNTLDSNTIIGAYRGISTSVTPPTSSSGDAIISSDLENIIINNRIINLTGADYNHVGVEVGGDIAIVGSYYSKIINNTIINSKCIASGAGISALDFSTIENNTVQVLFKGVGIHPRGSNITIKNNNISTVSGAGVLFNSFSFNLLVLSNNITSESGVGVLIQKLSSKRMPGNITILYNWISTGNYYSIDARDANSSAYWNIQFNRGPKGTGIVATPEGQYDPSKPKYNFNGTTYNITPSNYDEYFSSNGALNANIKDGDILNFNGEFDNKVILINSAIKITGNNPVFTNTTFRVSSDGVWIENLKITNIDADRINAWGILVNRAFGVTILNCDIFVQDPNAAYAIYVVDSGSVDVINNTLSSSGNYLTYTLLGYSIEDCRFINNTITTFGTGTVHIFENEHCIDGNSSCVDGNTVCPDGSTVCPDGSTVCPDGSTVCPDGSTVCPDGSIICPDGSIVCTDGDTNCVDGNSLSGNHVLREVFRTYGILMAYASDNIVSGNKVNVTSKLNRIVDPTNSTNSMVGIDLYYNCHNNVFSDNNVYVEGYDNYIYGMGVLGYYTGHDAPEGQGATNNQYIGNTIVVKGHYFVEGIVIGDESRNTLIQDNVVEAESTNVSYGVNLEMSQKSIISGNTFTLNSDIVYGIEAIDSNDNTIDNNEFEINAKQGYGFVFSKSSNNNVYSNTIDLYATGENITFKNFDSIPAGCAGIYLRAASLNNTIFDNEITTLKGYAIVVDDIACGNNISDNYLDSELGIGNDAINCSENNTIKDNYKYLVDGTLSSITVNYLENGTFEFIADSDDLNGAVVDFYVADTFINSAEIVDGRAALDYAFIDFTPSQYLISAIIHKENFKTTLFESSLLVQNGILIISLEDVNGTIGRKANFVATVKNILGQSVEGINVEFNVIDDGYTIYIGRAVSDNNGLAILNAEIPQIYSDDAKVYVKAVNPDNFEQADAYSNLTAKEPISTEFVFKLNVYPGGAVATLKDLNGSVLANKKVSLMVNGKTYNRTTDSNGKINIPILAPGSYTVYASFAGDNDYRSVSDSSKVTVRPSIKYNKNYSVFYGNIVSYKIRLVGSDGKFVGAGEVVTIKVAGKTYSVKTDKNGYATKNLKLKVGTYTITAEYHKHKVSNKIVFKQVLSARNIAVKQAKTIKFSAKLLDKNGKPFKNKVVTFKIKGKKYSAKTDAKGFATALIKDLKPGNYFIYSIYSGCTIKNTISVKK